MKLTRLSTLILLSLLTTVACSREKVQPPEDATTLTPEQKEAKSVNDYRTRQAAFADSVLGNAASASKLAEKFGKDFEVGSVKLRDSLMKYVATAPQCFKNGRDVDPYLAGTVTFYIHMSVVGSDVVRVQESAWTSEAGNLTNKCLTDAARQWKFGMGLTKPGKFLLQVQFK